MTEENPDELSLEERCTHKNWKVRIGGYERAVSLFKAVSDEQSIEWSGFVPMIKDIVADTNDPALERGLEVILLFVDKSPAAGKTVGQVMPSLAKKCIASPRPRTRDLALQICLTYVEIDKADSVISELLRCADSKNPKLSSACIHVIGQIVRSFGPKLIDVDLVLNRVLPLVKDRDKNVRKEVRFFIAELYRWLGESIKPYLDQIKPPKLNEIVAEIAKIQDVSHVPTRIPRSQLTNPKHIEQDEFLTTDDSLPIRMHEPPDLSTPVEILCQIPSQFHAHIVSQKWTDRRDALESLEKVLMSSRKIKNEDFSELFTRLINIISKDTNVVVVCLAIKCVTSFAKGLESEFAPHGSASFRALLDKLKEKKQNVVHLLRDALDAVYKAVPLEMISADLVEYMGNKNPQAKCEVALFLSRCFLLMPSATFNKKLLKPLMSSLVTLLVDQDPHVRECAAKALGVALKVGGEKNLSPFLTDVFKHKLQKIREYANTIPEQAKRSQPSGNLTETQTENFKPTSQSQTELNDTLSTKRESMKNAKTQHEKWISSQNKIKRHTPPVVNTVSGDINEVNENNIPKEFIRAISNENWSIRLQAISDLKQFVDTLSQVSPDLGELAELLASRILDSNPKIAATTTSLLMTLAQKIGPSFKKSIPIFLPPLLKGMGDSRKWMREAATDCVNFFGATCGYNELFEDCTVCNVLQSGSQTVRVALLNWVAEKLHILGPKEISSVNLINCLPNLFACMEDRNSEIRNCAHDAIGGFVKFLGLETVISSCERFSDAPNNSIIKIILEKTKDSVFQSRSLSAEDTSKQKHFNKKITVGNPSIIPPTCSGDSSPLLDINNLKHQRVIDEQKHKIVKWEFATPRAEFVELLKSLMVAAHFSQRLLDLMFHNDFKNHITALDLLMDEILENAPAVMSNLDLIFRWMTLRFFDSNPMVLSKCLDFLFVTLDALENTDYCLLDSEASAFVPYLIMKLSDPRENVLMKVKQILHKMSSIYPVNKLRKFVMEGMRTKSSRQKANCLEVFKSFIDIYGEAVYLKELDTITEGIVRLLKDRESAVKRNAFAVAASLFAHEGEKMLKFIEKYSGKDGKCIEQRILKYFSDRHVAKIVLPTQKRSHQNIVADVGLNSVAGMPNEEYSERTNDIVRVSENPIDTDVKNIDASVNIVRNIMLDQGLLDEVDGISNASVPFPKLVEVDLGFLYEQKTNVRIFPGQTSESCRLLYTSASPSKLRIESIGDDDLLESINFMKQVDALLNSENQNYLLAEADSLARHIGEKLRKLVDSRQPEALRCYGTAFTLLLTLCGFKQFVDRFSRASLRCLLEQLLQLISSNRFGVKENENYRCAVNTIILKVLENGGKTHLLCCLLQMLGDTKDSTMVSGKLHELCMKCLWKLTRAQSHWDGELNYSEIFMAMQDFLKCYEFPWWKSKVGDSALRTVKTMLRVMVNTRGERIFSDLDKASLHRNSELHVYARKLSKRSTSEKRGNVISRVVENDSPSKHNLSIRHAKRLSTIFREIAFNPSDGLARLSNFTAEHPEVDLNGILSKVSPEFLRYFSMLSDRSANHRPEAPLAGESGNVGSDPKGDSNFSKEAQRMWDRLKVLQSRIEGLKAS